MDAEVSRCRPLLGTFVEISVRSGSQPHERVAAAVSSAFAAIAKVQQLMSFHERGSDLGRINRLSAGECISVHPWTWEVLNLAKDIHQASDGRFDCGVGWRLAEWGLLPGRDCCSDRDSISTSQTALHMLDENLVRAGAPVCLDLGGIAKGYAVDRAVDVLRTVGIQDAIVNAGGDIRVLGAERPIHLRHPADASVLWYVGTLADGAIATSSPAFSTQYLDSGQRVCGLVDPMTYEPITQCRSYSVVAADCATADALTKVLAAGAPSDSCVFRRYGARTVVVQ